MKSFWSVLFDERYSQLDPDQAGGAAPGGRAQQTAATREQEPEPQRSLQQQRVDRLALLVEALVRTLESKGVLDLDAVKTEIKNLDLADGALDGRIGTGILRRYEE